MKEDITLIQSTQIYRCDDDDRMVIVYKQKEKIVGINYAQDVTMDLRDFMDRWGFPDEKLTKFYHAAKYLARGRGLTEIELINEIIWVKFNYEDNFFDVDFNLVNQD
mgnify:FL=1